MVGKYAFLLAACLLAIAAPARAGLFGEDPKITVDYAPASALIAHGAVQIGAFIYLPAMNGKLKSYALSNTSFADVLLNQDVDSFVRESLLKELRFIGIAIDSGPVLSGEIEEFKDDNVVGGLVTLVIRYAVKDAQGLVLYDAEKSTQELLGAGNVSSLDNAMTKNFEALVCDPAFIRAANGGRSVAAPVASMPPPGHSPLIAYAPSSAFIAGGAVTIGPFDYQPMATGKIDADQIRNTALGNIHLGLPVATYFSDAVLKEFRLTGVGVESKDRVLSGTIEELSCDDLGSSAAWTMDVKYSLKDAAGNLLYQGEKITKLVTEKNLGELNSFLRRNIEALLLDDAFLKAIGTPPGISNVAETVVPSDGWNWTEVSGYGPRSALVAHGSVWVGPFAYPVANGKVKPTEIPNRALMTTISADKPIAELMHDMTLNELRFTGIDVRLSDRVLTGEILKYKVDDIADPAEWAIAVHFVVKDKTGATLYDAVKSATPVNDRYVYNFREMKLIIEALISDPLFIKAIN